MKFSISQAARIAGVARKTLYNHIDKKGISVEKDDDGNPVIDASELIRIYGNDINLGLVKPTQVAGNVTQEVTPQINLDLAHEIALLQERINHLEEQKENFKTLFEEERKDKQLSIRMITDQRDEKTKWEEAIGDLKSQVSTQQDAQTELESFKKLAKKKVAQLKRELSEEKSKTILQRIFKK